MFKCLPGVECGVGVVCARLPFCCCPNVPHTVLRPFKESPSLWIGITLSCFEKVVLVVSLPRLVLGTTFFSCFGGDPEDKLIGITLSLRAVSPVTVVAITVVEGLAELEIKYREMYSPFVFQWCYYEDAYAELW